MLEDNPLSNIHPVFKAIYDDLLNRLKLAQTDLSTLTTNSATLATNLSQQTTDLLKAKADIIATVASIGQVASDVTKAKTDVASSATSLSQVTTDLAKAKTDMAATSASLSQVTADVTKAKSDITFTSSSLSQLSSDVVKAKSDLVATANDLIKTKSDVSSHSTLLAQHTTDISSQASTITKHTTDIGNRLRKDVADTTPYTLGVAPATAMSDALRKGDTIGGFMRPYRKFRAVGSADKAATVASGQSAAIVDPLNGGGVFEIGSIRMKTITPAALNTTVVLKNNGTTIWTQTIILTQLPAVNKITEFLSIASGLPPDISLPANLTMSSSSGVYEFTIDGLIVPPQ